jgi:hypothetical protein
MFRKTPLIQALKLAPKSIEMRTAMTLQDTADAGMGQSFIDLPKELSAMPVEPESEPEEEQPKAETADTAKKSEPKPEQKPTILITDVQARRLEVVAEESGWRQKDLLAWLKGKYMIASVSDVCAVDYEHIIELIRAGGEEPPKE